MKAEDTILTGEQMSEAIQKKTQKWSICNPEFIEDVAHIVAEAQAEVSFKAGITFAKERIQASLLTEEEIPDLLAKLAPSATYGNGLKAIAEAQLSRCLKALEEK